jgi:hypothetical protein
VHEKEETYKVNYKGATKTLNCYLSVRIGDESKEFKLLFISNKELEERDLYKWIKELETLNLRKPTTGEIEQKGEQIKKYINTRFDCALLQQKADEQIDRKLKSKCGFNQKS